MLLMTDFLQGELSRQPDPALYTEKEYERHLRAYQLFLRDFVRERLTIHGIRDALEKELQVDTEPTTIGSDGRFEKPLLHALSNGEGPAQKILQSSSLQNISPIQVVFVSHRALSPDEVARAQQICCGFVASFRKAIFDEISTACSETPLFYAFPDRTGRLHYHPSRVLDASVIDTLPSPLHAHRADGVAVIRRRLYEDVLADDGRMILYPQDRLKEHRQITTRGTQRVRGQTLEHFNSATGVLHLRKHDEQEVSNVGSVKYGPLRLAQLYIVREVLKALRSGDLEADDLRDLPNPTSDKIDYLQDRLALSEARCRELQDIYRYFLYIYCRSQYAASNGSESITIDPKPLQEHIDGLLGVLNMRKETRNDGVTFSSLKS